MEILIRENTFVIKVGLIVHSFSFFLETLGLYLFFTDCDHLLAEVVERDLNLVRQVRKRIMAIPKIA